tara:strand:- start:2146 stop:2475 length:330 start_codon:yes stop_codon:yes gene_type:complete
MGRLVTMELMITNMSRDLGTWILVMASMAPRQTIQKEYTIIILLGKMGKAELASPTSSTVTEERSPLAMTTEERELIVRGMGRPGVQVLDLLPRGVRADILASLVKFLP